MADKLAKLILDAQREKMREEDIEMAMTGENEKLLAAYERVISFVHMHFRWGYVCDAIEYMLRLSRSEGFDSGNQRKWVGILMLQVQEGLILNVSKLK